MKIGIFSSPDKEIFSNECKSLELALIENFSILISQFGKMFEIADFTLLGSSDGLTEQNISILHLREGIFILAILQFF